MVRTWDRRVTSPAMVAAWSLGVALAVQAGWLASGWLIAKLSVVVALSGLHGVLSGGLRRAARGSEPAGSAFRVYAVPAVIGGVLFIAVMAVVKPF